MRTLPRFWCLLVGGVGLAHPAQIAAQVRVELGPIVALYEPAGSFHSTPYLNANLPTDPSDNGGLAWGGQGRLWLGPRVGIQVQAAIAATSRRVVTPAGLFHISARVVAATVQGLYNLLPASATQQLWLSAGPGVRNHGGEAYAPYGSPTPLAGVLGVGFVLPIMSRLKANLGVTTLLYSFGLSDRTRSFAQSGFQVDLLLQAGLMLGWN